MIPVLWLDQQMLCWDQAIVSDIFSNRLWPTGYRFGHSDIADLAQATEFLDGLPSHADGAVVVIPGRYHADTIDQINGFLSRLDWCLLIVTSDEERLFPVEKLDHPNMALWVQTPNKTDEADVFLPVGYPPHLRGHLDNFRYGKDGKDWFFAGQVNTTTRKRCIDALNRTEGGLCIETPGFTQGLDHDEYASHLAGAKLVPCPSGPKTPDTFRMVEALEAGCIPVVEACDAWYWGKVLPVVNMTSEWAEFPRTAQLLLDCWPHDANQVVAAWKMRKRELTLTAMGTIRRLSDTDPDLEDLTVIVPTSPIESHPDTGIIEQTLASIRHWHPTAEIIVTCDGVRPEQERYRDRYERYLHKLLWLAAKDGRILPLVHNEHLHQAESTRRALEHVVTPLVLFVEHDCPLVTDEPIDWPALIAAARSGEADVIRLHHEALVLPDHEHLMLDQKPHDIAGAPLLRTVQWSQRPHLANTALYRRVLAEEFPEGHKGMIEDVMHGAVHSAWRDFGLAGWDRYRLWMYAPEGNLKRSYTLDGRDGDPQWVDS